MVPLPDAVAQPGTVVVEAPHAPPTLVAVLGPERLWVAADTTVAAGQRKGVLRQGAGRWGDVEGSRVGRGIQGGLRRGETVNPSGLTPPLTHVLLAGPENYIGEIAI